MSNVEGLMMMATSKIITPAVTPTEIEEPIGCLVCKTQQCGKDRCRCVTKSLRHGPYMWLVEYVPVEKREETKKHIPYKWTYLGPASKPEKMKENLEQYTGGHGTVHAKLEEKVTTFLTKYEEDPEFRRKILQNKETKLGA